MADFGDGLHETIKRPSYFPCWRLSRIGFRLECPPVFTEGKQGSDRGGPILSERNYNRRRGQI